MTTRTIFHGAEIQDHRTRVQMQATPPQRGTVQHGAEPNTVHFGDALKTRVQHGGPPQVGADPLQTRVRHGSGPATGPATRVTQIFDQAQNPPQLSAEEVIAELEGRQESLSAKKAIIENELQQVAAAIEFAQREQAKPETPSNGKGQAESLELGELTVSKAQPHIAAQDDPATLSAWAEVEEAGKARKSIIDAIDSRLGELEELELAAEDKDDEAEA